ncbi:hypothetical protein BJX66DRAFT_150855 [Aspergillus keveii]|uniref:Uncharacterized protein n=1 Tax=Aspergillus keveii TaxID=714993 RepID=A0ABR4GNE3_9EURO
MTPVSHNLPIIAQRDQPAGSYLPNLKSSSISGLTLDLVPPSFALPPHLFIPL